MKFLSVFALALSFLPLARAATNATPVPAGALRQTVAIVLPRPSGLSEIFCSGTLIGPRTVLSAAHCFGDAAETSLQADQQTLLTTSKIYIGDTPPESQLPFVQPSYDIAKVDLMPGYDEEWQDDFALLTLAHDVDLKKFSISPVGIAAESEVSESDSILSVGYGMRQNGGTKGWKDEFTLPINRMEPGVDLNIGADGKPGPSGCHGDSGGSAYVLLPGGGMKLLAVADTIEEQTCGMTSTNYLIVGPSVRAWIQQLGAVLF